MSAHWCYAEGCEVEVPPRMLMCLRHWRMVPRDLQDAIWRTYRPGQEIDKCPSEEYMVAQRRAIAAFSALEGERK